MYEIHVNVSNFPKTRNVVQTFINTSAKGEFEKMIFGTGAEALKIANFIAVAPDLLPTRVITSLIRSDYPISTTRSVPYAGNYIPYQARLPNHLANHANQSQTRACKQSISVIRPD